MEEIIEIDTGKFVLRPYTDGDEEGVLSLWRAAFGKEMDQRVWRWKYLQNPYGHKILLCVGEQGMIAALYGGIPYRANLEGNTIEIIQLMDLMSHPDYRGKGLFVRTGNGLLDFYCRPQGASFLYGFPGKHHFVLGEKYLNYKALKGGVSFLTARTADLARNRKPFQGRVERIERVSSFFDPLWATCSGYYPLSIIRDTAFIQWRFFAHPFQEYEVWGYRPYLKKGLKAYAVFSADDQRARLIDILAMPSKNLLIDFFARLAIQFLDRGIKEIEAWLPSPHFITEAALSSGFQNAPEPLGIIPTVRSFAHSPSLEFISRRIFYTMADADLL